MLGNKPPLKKKKLEVSPKARAYMPYTFLFVSVFSLFSLLSFTDMYFQSSNNLFGRVGQTFAYITFYLFGRSAYIIGILSFVFGLLHFQKKPVDLQNLLLSVPVLLVGFSILFSIFELNITGLKDGGGFIGLWLSGSMEYVFGQSGRILLDLGIIGFGLIIVLREGPRDFNSEYYRKAWDDFSKKYPIREKLDSYVNSLKNNKEENEEEVQDEMEHIPWFEIRRREQGIHASSSRPYSTVSEVVDEFEEEEAEIVSSGNTRSSSIIDRFEYRPIPPRVKEAGVSEESAYMREDIQVESIPSFKSTPESIVNKIYKSKFSETKPSITSTNIDSYIVTGPEADVQNIVTIKEEDEIIYDAEPLGDMVSGEEIKPELKGIMSDSLLSDTGIKEDVIDKDLFGNKIELDKKTQPQKTLKMTSVPDVVPKRKGEYYMSHKILPRQTEKKIDPLFKLDAEHVSRKIEEIIKEYGYDSRVVSYEKGPIITRYELTPPPGIKLGRITSLTDELKLYLAVKSIRIVAPIPGKSTIGIEVPNKNRADVFLADILREQQEMLHSAKELTIVLGKDSITGRTITGDLNKLPHLLVAGTTGSGKSVSMNSMICSLIFSKSPEEVRFIMIDPKMVEFALYEDIPYLLMPVITDPRKASKALSWAVQEMEARYNIVSELKCRDLKAYNEKVETSLAFTRKGYKKIPYIVIFIDELADLMMVSGKDLEDYVTRISQKSRAVGIHLVMATQRPSVDVITGLIKANCPARIAFHVAQKTDSKIILDYNGADTLLGKGDLLYKSPTSPDLQRIQAPYITEDEIDKIVTECRKYADAEYVDINLDEEAFDDDASIEDEADFEEAWNIVKTERKASASYLQRRLRIGYNKAARLMEMMEERGYVGPQIGSKPREILR